jgi:hypothetical protein
MAQTKIEELDGGASLALRRGVVTMLRQSRCSSLLGPSRCEVKALAHLKRPISLSYGINTPIYLDILYLIL